MNCRFRTVEISDPRFESGGLRHITVKSRALQGRADLTLFVPPGAEETPNLPLAILLHGVYGSHWAWTLSGGAHRALAQLVDSGEIRPLALAMPSDGLWGDGSGYVKHAVGPDFESWIVEDVPAAAALGAPGSITPDSPIFVAGLSMGGFGALRIGAKHPDRFRAMAGHSSITHFDQLAQFVEEPLSGFGVAEADKSVLDTMLANRDKLSPFRFDCGTEDPLIEPNRALHRLLKERGIRHVYEEYPGGHEWQYWETHIADSLRFFAAALPR
jgi:putative tributyrin esterase